MSGFEGDADQILNSKPLSQLPDPLRKIVTSKVDVINGCHPYGEALFNRCVYGVFDQSVMVLMETMEMNGL